MTDEQLDPNAEPQPEQMYSTTRVGELFEVSAETVRNWIEKGELKAVKLGGTYWRVASSEVIRFANQRFDLED